MKRIIIGISLIFGLVLTTVALAAVTWPLLFSVGGGGPSTGTYVYDGKATKFTAPTNSTVCQITAVLTAPNSTSTYIISLLSGDTSNPDQASLIATASASGTAWTSWNDPGITRGELLFTLGSCISLTGGQKYWFELTSTDTTGRNTGVMSITQVNGQVAANSNSGWNIYQNYGYYFIAYGQIQNAIATFTSPLNNTHVSSTFPASGYYQWPSNLCVTDTTDTSTIVCYVSSFFHFSTGAINASGTVPVWDTPGISSYSQSQSVTENVNLPGGTYSGSLCLRNGFDIIVCSPTSTIIVDSSLTRFDLPPTRYDNSALAFQIALQANSAYSCEAETFFSAKGLECTTKNILTILFQPNDGSISFAVSKFADVKNVFPLSTVFGAITTVQNNLNTVNASGTPPALVVATYNGVTLLSFGNSEVSNRLGATVYNFVWDLQDKFFWFSVTLAALGTILAVL